MLRTPHANYHRLMVQMIDNSLGVSSVEVETVAEAEVTATTQSLTLVLKRRLTWSDGVDLPPTLNHVGDPPAFAIVTFDK